MKYGYKISYIFVLSLIYSMCNVGILAFINEYVLIQSGTNFKILVVLFTLLLLFFVFSYTLKLVVSRINNEMIYELRVKFVVRILNTKIIFNDKKAKILASLSKDINNISNGFMRLSDAILGFLFLFLSFFYFLYLSFELAIFTILWMIFLAFVLYYFINRTRIYYINSRQYDDELYLNYEELLYGFKELRIDTKRSESFKEKFLGSANLQKNENIKAEIFGAISGNFLNVALFFAIGILMYLSSALGFSDFKTAVTFSIAIMFLRTPLIISISSIPSILLAFISLKKIKDLELIKFENIKYNNQNSALKWQKITLKNINFSYKNNEILKNINLEIKKSEITFLVGENGSGKSTLFLLLCGLLKPKSGEIFIDDKILKDEDLQNFQNTISVIFSDFYLFRQILNSDENQLNFWCDVLKLDLEIKDQKIQNTNLSSGQKKRAALLQILLQNRDFIMLDEFTAELDPEFRKYFYTNILSLLKSHNIGVFAISHDDRYFSVADKIYVMKNGILEKGKK